MHGPASFHITFAVVAVLACFGISGVSRADETSLKELFSFNFAVPDTEADWSVRAVTESELEAIAKRDPSLSPSVTLRILANLNGRDFDYIHEDVRNGVPLRVPYDFAAFRNWTPMPRRLPEVSDLPKFILIVKNSPHIGWYEHGRLVGNTYICIGKQETSTNAGIYSVLEKDPTHVSRSYPNAYGEPAPMPWALRVYEHVWIHAGDITKGYCSHGCINLPVFPAMHLFEWAPRGAPVLIAESLGEVSRVLAANRTSCALRASLCKRKGPQSG
ncbi:MAG: L,D-transpeptidase [Desulfobacteraceae bacterium]|nr:L,D-transpeptidase [Desulfobacteraceae bacterium]